jgi:hypothetical protein
MSSARQMDALTNNAFRSAHNVDPLIPDSEKEIVFSVKSGDWLTLAKRDATYVPPKSGNKKTAQKKARKKKSSEDRERQVAALVAGGELGIVINTDAPDAPANQREIATLFSKWPALAGHTVEQLAPRIRIIDANHLKTYLQRRRLFGDFAARWADKLGVELPREFATFEEWKSRDVQVERDWPTWQADADRDRARDTVVAFLSATEHRPASERVLRVSGSPGIGKTRLVAEAIGQCKPDVQRSTLIATSTTKAIEWIDDGGFRRFPTAVLIVDDVSAAEADDIAASFRRRAPDELSGAVVVLTPARLEPAVARGSVELLRNLSDQPMGNLVREASPTASPEVVDRIVALSEGVPWFAHLVAKHGDWDAQAAVPTIEKAMKIAVVGRRDPSNNFPFRARCILVVWLCEHGPLPVDAPTRERLQAALGLRGREWAFINDELKLCVDRAIVRRNTDGHYYVSPAILLREVIRWAFGPNGPDGFKESLTQYAPKEFERAMARLPELGITDGLMREVVTLWVQSLDSVETLAGLQRVFTDEETLPFLARYAAEQTATGLLALLRRSPREGSRDEAYGAERARWTLQNAWGYGAPFSLIEQGFYELALRQGPASSATELWSVSHLFATGWDDEKLETALERLRARSRSEHILDRRLAVIAFRRSIDSGGAIWPEVPNRPHTLSLPAAQLAAGAVEGLLSLCSDPAMVVANEAVASLATVFAAAARLRAIRFDQDGVARWIEMLDDRARADVTESIRRTFPMGAPSYVRWMELLRPASFSARVRDALFSRDFSSTNDELAKFAPLARTLIDERFEDWPTVRAALYDRNAAHSMAFSIALGRADDAHRCLDGLIDDVRAGLDVQPLGAYLVGRADAGEDLDALTEQWTDAPLVLARIDAIGRVGPSDTQAAWLEQRVRNATFPLAAARSLSYGRWDRVPFDRVAAFIRACVGANEPALFAVATHRMYSLLRDHAARPESDALCVAMMERADAERWWNTQTSAGLDAIALRLLESGRVEVVCQSLAKALRDDPSSVALAARPVLRACAERAPAALWTALLPLIDVRGNSFAFDVLLEHEFSSRAPADLVDEWVGDDAQRARWVASWCSLAAELHPLTRRIIERFSRDALVLDTLSHRLITETREDYSAQLDHASATLDHWKTHGDCVAEWVRRAAEPLARERRRVASEAQRPTGS